jgi:hypothetical protein
LLLRIEMSFVGKEKDKTKGLGERRKKAERKYSLKRLHFRVQLWRPRIMIKAVLVLR